jgi:DNA-binding transcriptional ArsR family regulator
MADELDAVFRALADPTRRRILDLLKPGPRTTGDLAEQFEELSRFAVMKHLGVLERAGLVLVRRRGRERYNFLNTVPIRQVYERWMGPYSELWSSSLLRLKDHVERDKTDDH